MMVRELRLVGLPPFLGDPFTILPPEGKSLLDEGPAPRGLVPIVPGLPASSYELPPRDPLDPIVRLRTVREI